MEFPSFWIYTLMLVVVLEQVLVRVLALVLHQVTSSQVLLGAALFRVILILCILIIVLLIIVLLIFRLFILRLLILISSLSSFFSVFFTSTSISLSLYSSSPLLFQPVVMTLNFHHWTNISQATNKKKGKGIPAICLTKSAVHFKDTIGFVFFC